MDSEAHTNDWSCDGAISSHSYPPADQITWIPRRMLRGFTKYAMGPVVNDKDGA